MKHNLLIKSSVSESSLSSLENSDEPEDVETNAKVSMKQKRKRKANDDDFSVPTSPRKKRAIKLEPVYIIPDIARKETKFRGRLGYACLNTVLRNKKPASEAVFCSRTCRLDSLKKNGIEWVKDIGRRNVEDLLTLIQWNEDNVYIIRPHFSSSR